MCDISVIIPFYNDSKSCIQLVNSYLKSFAKLDLSFEFIITDDFSSKEESDCLIQTFNTNKSVQILRFTKNIGQYGSLAFGISKSKGRLLLITDQDILDLPTKDLTKLINNSSNFDLQYIYQESNQRGIARTLFSSLWHLFIVLNTKKQTSLENPLPFRLISNELKEKLIQNNYTITTLDISLLKHSKQYFFYKIDDEKPLIIKTKSEYSLRMLVKIGVYSIISLITDLKVFFVISTILLSLYFWFGTHSLTLPLITLFISAVMYAVALLVSKEQSYNEQVKQIEKCVEK